MTSSGGDPQRFRSISRELKRGSKVEGLVVSARAIRDPYYRSLALAEIGLKGNMDEERSVQTVEEALSDASSVPSEWRRGELLGELLHQAIRSGNPRKSSLVKAKVIELLGSIPSGHGLSEGIMACARSADAAMGMALLSLSLRNKGFELENGKVVLKALFREKGPSPQELEALVETINGEKGPVIRTLLLSYLSHQLDQASRGEEASVTYSAAVMSLAQLEERELLQAFNDLARKAPSRERLEPLIDLSLSEDDPHTSVKMLSVASDTMDRLGDRAGAQALLQTGMERAEKVPAERRGELLASCSNAFRRLGDNKRADELSSAALALSERDEAASRKVRRVLGMDKGPNPREDAPLRAPSKVVGANHVLALYDTYEGRTGPVHLRALARAAPLCWAFSLDLALIGFPTDDLKRLVDLSTKETSVGEEGRFIRSLAEEGRIKLVRCGKDPPPSVWDGLGMPVATTPHPDKAKALDMEMAVRTARSHPSSKVCLVMGLGKRGLPPSLLRTVPHHLELTGRNISLETATAMGIMAYMLYLSTKGTG